MRFLDACLLRLEVEARPGLPYSGPPAKPALQTSIEFRRIWAGMPAFPLYSSRWMVLAGASEAGTEGGGGVRSAAAGGKNRLRAENSPKLMYLVAFRWGPSQ